MWQYEYTLKDHLGNTRVTFADLDGSRTIEPNTEINQINHYYPFGLNMEGNWNGASGNNKYQLTGKEWNDDFGLGMNDFGARLYDPTIGKWNAVDPLAEGYLSWSPYNYCKDNPIKFIDPTGMASEAYTSIDQANRFAANAEAQAANFGKTDQARYNSITNDDIAGGTTDSKVINTFCDIQNGNTEFSNVTVKGSSEFKEKYESDKTTILKSSYGQLIYAFLQNSSVPTVISEAWAILGFIDKKFNLYNSITEPVILGGGKQKINVKYAQVDGLEHDGGAISKSYYTLIHELQHAVDFISYFTQVSFSGAPLDNKHNPLNGDNWEKNGKYFERRAVTAENVLRKSLNDNKYRLNYSGKEIF